VSFKAPAPFKPPHGFEATSSKSSSAISKTFSKANLAGKEIWYITAPASVPASAIQQVSLQNSKKTNISHNGSKYGFVEDVADDKTYTKLMVPSDRTDGYETCMLEPPFEEINTYPTCRPSEDQAHPTLTAGCRTS
jgi:hypothetical protein